MCLRPSPHPPELFDGERHRADMLAANQLVASQTFSVEETLLAAARLTNVSTDSADASYRRTRFRKLHFANKLKKKSRDWARHEISPVPGQIPEPMSRAHVVRLPPSNNCRGRLAFLLFRLLLGRRLFGLNFLF